MAIIPRRRADGSMSYGVQIYLPGGGRSWEGTYDTRQEAKTVERDAESAAQKAGRRGQETCGEFAARWPDDYGVQGGRPRWADSTRYSNGLALRGLIETFGDVKLARLPNDDRFIPWAEAQPASNVKVMRAMLADARRSRLISENPLSELGQDRSKGRSLIEAITEDELELLGDCALRAWRPQEYGSTARALVMWQGAVGSRPVALRSLLREHVDLDAGEAYLEHPGKNVDPRTVLVPPAALEAAAAMPRRIDVPFFFTSITGKRLAKHSEFYLWNPIRTLFEAELPPARARQLRDAREDGGPMEFYELRHCAATSMRRRGASWEAIAWQLCQTDRGYQARTRYSHLTEEDHLSDLRALFGRNVVELGEAKEAAGG